MRFKIAQRYNHCESFWFSYDENSALYHFVGAGNHLEIFYENEWMISTFKGNINNSNEILNFVESHLQHFDKRQLVEIVQEQNGSSWLINEGFVVYE